jgi:hypothetical protein
MKITVVTAVYNNRETIAQALESTLCQTHGDIERVVLMGVHRMELSMSSRDFRPA